MKPLRYRTALLEMHLSQLHRQNVDQEIVQMWGVLIAPAESMISLLALNVYTGPAQR